MSPLCQRHRQSLHRRQGLSFPQPLPHPSKQPWGGDVSGAARKEAGIAEADSCRARAAERAKRASCEAVWQGGEGNGEAAAAEASRTSAVEPANRGLLGSGNKGNKAPSPVLPIPHRRGIDGDAAGVSDDGAALLAGAPWEPLEPMNNHPGQREGHAQGQGRSELGVLGRGGAATGLCLRGRSHSRNHSHSRSRSRSRSHGRPDNDGGDAPQHSGLRLPRLRPLRPLLRLPLLPRLPRLPQFCGLLSLLFLLLFSPSPASAASCHSEISTLMTSNPSKCVGRSLIVVRSKVYTDDKQPK